MKLLDNFITIEEKRYQKSNRVLSKASLAAEAFHQQNSIVSEANSLVVKKQYNLELDLQKAIEEEEAAKRVS